MAGIAALARATAMTRRTPTTTVASSLRRTASFGVRERRGSVARRLVRPGALRSSAAGKVQAAGAAAAAPAVGSPVGWAPGCGAACGAAATVTVPFMSGCAWQTYGKVPVSSNVLDHEPLANELLPDQPSPLTLCDASSKFHVTDSPTFTDTSAGANASFATVTVAGAAEADDARAPERPMAMKTARLSRPPFGDVTCVSPPPAAVGGAAGFIHESIYCSYRWRSPILESCVLITGDGPVWTDLLLFRPSFSRASAR